MNSSTAGDAGIVRIASAHSVPESAGRLESLLKERGVLIFARIDFSGDAARAGLDMRPEQMLIFGNPKAGTPLMQAEPAAGLDPKAQGYGGWDGPGRQLTGHIAGHYLSAVSMMYASTGDVRFKERADDMVSQLQAIQNAQHLLFGGD